MQHLPPLGLYVHIPWCVRKCPYCDFNSHYAQGDIPEQAYLACLLGDLRQESAQIADRPIQSVFIGGGTPSLLKVQTVASLIAGIKQTVAVKANAEVTLEANPSTLDNDKLNGFVDAGVTRFSIGVQSFNAQHLHALGRIHNKQQAITAIEIAQNLPLTSFNLDLMHGLPEQTSQQALADLQQAIALAPPHLSWYQLTIEPHTPFASKRPNLPDEEALWEIEHQGMALLEKAGYTRYEVSAYATPDHFCQHNQLYWRFGDYLGIGCGAHGKITCPKTGVVQRRVKIKHPRGYLDLTRPLVDKSWQLTQHQLPVEYFMNRLRLFEPIPKAEFNTFTGLDPQMMQPLFQDAYHWQLLEETPDFWRLLPKGRFFINRILRPMMTDVEQPFAGITHFLETK